MFCQFPALVTFGLFQTCLVILMLGNLCFVLGAWCAANNNDQQYLQIDLGGMRKVTQIASQGRPASNDYVSSYKISYSQVGNSFEFHRMVIILFISTSVRI